MRLQFTDDTFQDVLLGLLEPTAVPHTVDYDRVDYTMSFGGTPVTTVVERTGPHSGSDGYQVGVKVYPVTVGPDAESDVDPIQETNIIPIESSIKDYVRLFTKRTAEAIDEIGDDAVVKVYDQEVGEVLTATASPQVRFPDGYDEPGVSHRASHNSAPPSPIGVDISGVTLWYYGIGLGCPDAPSTHNDAFAVEKHPTDVCADDGGGIPTQAINTESNIPRHIGHARRAMPLSSANVLWNYVSAVSVSGDAVEQQTSLDAYADGRSELDFSPSHDALI